MCLFQRYTSIDLVFRSLNGLLRVEDQPRRIKRVATNRCRIDGGDWKERRPVERDRREEEGKGVKIEGKRNNDP